MKEEDLIREQIGVCNPERLHKVAIVQQAIKATLGADVKILCGPHSTDRSCWVIRVEGEKIDFPSPLFALAREAARNAEVYPLSDGRVRVAFLFDNMILQS